jgi:hypothetical protein
LEKIWGWFFFARTFKEIDTVFKYIRRQFPNVFEGGGQNRKFAESGSFIDSVRGGIESRERLKLIVMNFLPSTYQINSLNLYDFFFFANEAKSQQMNRTANKK